MLFSSYRTSGRILFICSLDFLKTFVSDNFLYRRRQAREGGDLIQLGSVAWCFSPQSLGFYFAKRIETESVEFDTVGDRNDREMKNNSARDKHQLPHVEFQAKERQQYNLNANQLSCAQLLKKK